MNRIALRALHLFILLLSIPSFCAETKKEAVDLIDSVTVNKNEVSVKINKDFKKSICLMTSLLVTMQT